MSLLVIMSLFNGLTLAALLFITASGLTLSFSLMRVVNLTHGAFYMAGGFIGVSVIKVTGSWLLAMFAGGGANPLSRVHGISETVDQLVRGVSVRETVFKMIAKIILDFAAYGVTVERSAAPFTSRAAEGPNRPQRRQRR